MTGGNYTALQPERTLVSGKERVSLSRKTGPKRHWAIPHFYAAGTAKARAQRASFGHPPARSEVRL